MHRKAPRFWIWASSLALFFVVLLNAWVSDDAYITFRTCFNLANGHGPVYNLAERVQTFTNPLWMFLISGIYWFTGEAYFTSIVLSLCFLSGTVWLLHQRMFRGSWASVAVVFLLGWSLSFVEYSTSGLENVLNGFLLTLFFAVYLDAENGRKKLIHLSLIAALGMVSRMDTALLYFPAVAAIAWQNRSWRAIAWLGIGFSPFLLWEAFATWYYGFPFPNTAYAKLNSGISQAVYWQHGLWYYLNVLKRDPITLAIMALGLGCALGPSSRRHGILALGIVLYAIYIARIGGDFMAGRFFYLPVLGAAVFVGKTMENARWGWLFGAALMVLGLANAGNPWYNGWRPQQPLRTLVDPHGIADERGWYHDPAALAALNDTMWALTNERNLDANRLDKQPRTVLFWDFLGYMGYGVGPSVHVCDRYALADPLLARLPMADFPDWRIGHFERVFPRGYRKTLRTGTNHIQDEALCEYYGNLALVTRGSLWSWDRLKTIGHFNLGHYDQLIDREFYRNPSPLNIPITALQRRHPIGEAFRQNGQVEIYNHRPLDIHLTPGMKFPRFEISLYPESEYILYLLKDTKTVVEMRIYPDWERRGMAIDTLDIPEELIGKFDAIRVEGVGGSEYYSIGHLIPLPNEYQ